MAEQLATADRCSYADERDEGETQERRRVGGEGKGEEEEGGALNLVNTPLCSFVPRLSPHPDEK